jgi:hypothetical protein
MAKIVDYPRASLESGMQLAEAIASLGGNSSVEMAADKMNRKVSGAFAAVVSAAVKYGLISSKDGRLTVQPLFRSIKLAYTEDEKRKFISQALLSPPLFKAIADRFEGHALPTDHFEKLLIREFDVPQDIASRIAQYFVQGCRQAGLLGGNGVLSTKNTGVEQSNAVPELEIENEPTEEPQRAIEKELSSAQKSPMNEFSICFRGPGLDSTILIREEEDLMIVGAMLKKVEKALKDKI